MNDLTVATPRRDDASTVRVRRVPSVERLLLSLVIVLAVVVPALAWWDLPIPGRSVLAVAFALLAPGLPAALMLLPRNRVLQAGLTPVLSLGTVILVSLVQVLTDTWNPAVAASISALIAAILTPAAWSRAPRYSDVRARPDAALVVGAGGLVVALGFWLWAVAVVDLDRIAGWGLVSALPWQFVIAVLITIMVVAAALRSRPHPRAALLAASSILLILFTTTFVSLADGGAVVSTGYVHVGFVDAIAATGRLVEATDARFSWPGFFTAAAVVVSWAGLPDATGLLVLYPAVVGALGIPSFYAIGLALTRSPRVAWLGVILYGCGNWVQQDYFSPQSIAVLLYLAIIAILLTRTADATVPRAEGSLWRRISLTLRRTPSRPAGETSRRAFVTEALLVGLIVVLVVTHQLTPVALITALALLALTGVIRSRTLWFAAATIFAAWFAFGAGDWWAGNLSVLIDGFGRADDALQAGVVDRVRGDDAYRVMQTMRVAWAGLFAVGGAIGWILSRREFPMAAAAALIAAPVILIVAQPYGGEIVLRVFLYALPILAVLSARALKRLLTAPGATGTLVLAVLLCAAVLAGVAARGVNTAFERNPADALTAAQAVRDDAVTGAIVIPLETEGTLRAGRVGELRPARFTDEGTTFEQFIASGADYIYFSQSRARYETLVNRALYDWFPMLVTQLLTSGVYQVFYEGEYTTVLKRVTEEDAE